MSYFDSITPKKPPPITKLEKKLQKSPIYKKHFVNEHLLKSQIDQIKLSPQSTQERRSKEDTFYKHLDDDITKLNKFCVGRITEISKRLDYIAKAIQSSVENETDMMVEISESDIDLCAQDLCDLDTFVGLNYIHVIKIVEQFDLAVGSMARVWIQVRLDNEPFCNIKFDGILLALSDVYYTYTHGTEEKSTWSPPDSFDRQTTKFFVRPEHIIKIKTLIVKHLPTLVFGKNQGVLADWNSNLDFSISDSSSITSVYFDNENFDQYHARLFREEGATLIRIRWYGKYGKTVFVEQKTHHESWVQAMSVKERFQLKTKLVKKFIDGTWKYEDQVQKLVEAGVKNESIAKNWALANEVQQNIIDQKLKPVIRTTYERTAFQLTSTNHVRISLDTDMRIIKEPKDPGPDNWAHLGQFDPEAVLNFPLGVLEIKLHDYPPKWVLSLVEEGYLIRAERFSKFQHAIGYHYGKEVNCLPHWFDKNWVKLQVAEGSVWYSPGGVAIDSEESARVLQKTSMSLRQDPSIAQPFSKTMDFLQIDIEPITPLDKVEPKVLFASERMLIRWMKLMLMWSSLGIYFIGRHNISESIAGYILICNSVLLLSHQLYQYHVRRYGIRYNVVYEDRVGPNVLVPMMLFALVIACIFSLTIDNGGDITLSKKFWFLPSQHLN